MSDITITKAFFDEKLKSEKGWICNQLGNEYIYDFHLAKYPIIVKVYSGVRIDTEKARNKGSDTIRILAVQKESIDKKAKIVDGLVRARRIYQTDYWTKRLEEQVKDVIASSKVIYDKYRRKK